MMRALEKMPSDNGWHQATKKPAHRRFADYAVKWITFGCPASGH
jgi:hypothetical protein